MKEALKGEGVLDPSSNRKVFSRTRQGVQKSYTWLIISPFSGTKTCTGAPSVDLRSTYTGGTCVLGPEARPKLSLPGGRLLTRNAPWRSSEWGRLLRRRARSCHHLSSSETAALLSPRPAGLSFSEGVRTMRLWEGTSRW